MSQWSKAVLFMGKLWKLASMGLAGMVMSCATPVIEPTGHITASPAVEQDVPPLIREAPLLPPPQPAEALETYSVSVQDVPVKELLFALARDAKINVDLHPQIKGTVTLNAVKQTLPQMLNRISKQIPLRWEVDHANLLISPDLPYLRHYKINYVNLSRSSKSQVSVATEIATAGGSVSGQSTGGGSSNKSNTLIESKSDNTFWQSLIANIQNIMQERGAGTTSGKDESQGSSNVIANPMSGVISVRARQHQHQQIQSFIDRVVNNALRQVLIEATILEVELNNRHQSGIDWSRLAGNNGADGNGPNLNIKLTDPSLNSSPFVLAQYTNAVSDFGNIAAALRVLETFGDVKVLSSPKLMALNNQTALLKVVDEKVYFTVSREIKEATDSSPEREIFSSEIHTVPVGVIMMVTPRINDNGTISMNVRPTITRITGYATDPGPRLASAVNNDSAFDNLIPEIQVREMESLLHVHSGNTVILGGLMQDKSDKKENRIPILGRIPLLGRLFSYHDDGVSKTELVIFLRPQIIHDASLQGDLKSYQSYLPRAGKP